jgi:hypothetical protein
MGILRGLPGSVILVLLIVGAVAGCSQGEPKANLSTVSPAATPSVSASASQLATKVPVNQIPPGNPASWVPSGVPTTAPYKEPGDVVPMFTQAMFVDNQSGAFAAATYYLKARNWALAVNDPAPFTLICDASKCKGDGKLLTGYQKTARHLVGGRWVMSPPSVLPAPADSGSEWVVQLKVTLGPVKLIDSRGAVVASEPSSAQPTNLHMHFAGNMWRVAGHNLAG